MLRYDKNLPPMAKKIKILAYLFERVNIHSAKINNNVKFYSNERRKRIRRQTR